MFDYFRTTVTRLNQSRSSFSLLNETRSDMSYTELEHGYQVNEDAVYFCNNSACDIFLKRNCHWLVL